jgi:predicted membrane metal-binding protein
MGQHQTHERYAREGEVTIGSDRGFGLVFAVVFALIGLWPAVRGGDPRLWSLAIAVVFLGAALYAPDVLRPLNRVWFSFGLLLSKIVSPVIMGLLFVTTVIPTALIMRLRGGDLLRLRLEREATSYWIVRDPPGPAPDSMRKQF